MFFIHLLLYIASFIFIWFGAGLIVSSVERFSKKLRLSPFSVSFIVLGLLTSTPEFAVGITAVLEKDPEIFVGNLLGGIPVIFLCVIPLLAILGNGITIRHTLSKNHLIATLAVILAPSFMILDRRVTNFEGMILIILYLVLILIIERKRGFLDTTNIELSHVKSYSYKDAIKVLAGIFILFISSNAIVAETMYFSEFFHISPFLLSLIVLSLGTNLPELSLAVRSVFSGKKDVAFGDYMGSAAANTILFGVFTIMNDGEVLTVSNFMVTFFFIALGIVLFYIFSRSERIISRKEGIILLCVYITFLLFQFAK